MKKLDDIPRKNPFEVPDGYFEKLPGKIQNRIAEANRPAQQYWFFSYKLQYVLPVVIMLVVAFVLVLRHETETSSAEQLLAEVDTEILIDFIAEGELTTEELLDQLPVNEVDETSPELELNTFEDSTLMDITYEDLELI